MSNWEMSVVLVVCVARRAWLSLRVSWSWRRSWRIDSGVGEEAEEGISRFYIHCVSHELTCLAPFSNDKERTYLIVAQSHPRRQIVRYSQDVPQGVDLEFVE